MQRLASTRCGAVIAPVAGVKTDNQAVAILRDAYPDREVVPVPGAVLAYGGGGPHCLSQALRRTREGAR